MSLLIKWNSKAEKDADKAKKKIEGDAKRAAKEKYKGKDVSTMPTKDKDELLEKIAKDLGYI